MPDYKQLCAELHAALDKHDLSLAEDELLDRSAAALRAALAEPKPPSLKAGAIEVLDELDGLFELPAGHYNTILRALEKLDDSL